MIPDIGQGGCAALEDSVVLARCLAKALSGKTSKESKEKDEREMDEYKRIEMGLKKCAKERKWGSIELISTAYIVGLIQQSNDKILAFLSQDQVAGGGENSDSKDNGEDSVPSIEMTSSAVDIIVAVFTRYGIMQGIEHDFIIYEYFKFEAGEREGEWERGSEYRINAVECGVYGRDARGD
ncbi:hypothetical protein CMV_010681 [Castanea mollissima]|uniref:Uncharacterized protein n=1 Tax=Castanea mollissima TaxID=60419 RepID=A0A8J4RIV1_9ROSI|nr:hypothetical protein CMV_010681 [Castanea mollissima]